LVTSMFAQAQESGSGDEVVKNKKGNEILPKAGDIAIGFNTIPIINLFFGTLSRNPGTSSPNVVNYTQNSNNQIVAKYFLTAKSAIRIRLGINTLSGGVTNRVQDSKVLYDAGFGTQDEIEAARIYQVKDEVTFKKSNWAISAGYEMRRGYRRLQGFMGGELGFGGFSSKQSISYGNAMSDQYAVEYTNDFNTGGTTFTDPTEPRANHAANTRNLETTNRSGFRMGIRGFIGVEYFIFTKISIAAEYGWGWAMSRRGRQTTTNEVYSNGQSGPVVVIEEVNNDSNEKRRGFSVDNNTNPTNPFSLPQAVDNNTTLLGGTGALTLLFHF